MLQLRDFREIVVVDFEFNTAPVCACAKELRSGKEYMLWADELARLKRPPWADGPEVLFVSFSASAELSCYRQLGWPMPRHILDLLFEFRLYVNGKRKWPKQRKRSLLNALRYFGLPAMTDEEKESWQKLILSGGPWDAEQIAGILRYCMVDVKEALALLGALASRLPGDLRQALLRGRYAIAVTDMERRGIPMDGGTWDGILIDREPIQLAVAQWLNREFPIYDGTTFRMKAFEAQLEALGLAGKWKRTRRSERYRIDDDAFKVFSWHPRINSIRQVRQVIQQLKKPGFLITGGRNYYNLKAFEAVTSRNATKGCSFQAPSWIRALVVAEEGRCLINTDYKCEEFAIAGVLSGDKNIQAFYTTPDPYVTYGIRAGLIPKGGDKNSHPKERDLIKTLLLASQYGISEYGLAVRLNVSPTLAEQMLTTLKQIFPTYYDWSGPWCGREDGLVN